MKVKFTDQQVKAAREYVQKIKKKDAENHEKLHRFSVDFMDTSGKEFQGLSKEEFYDLGKKMVLNDTVNNNGISPAENRDILITEYARDINERANIEILFCLSKGMKEEELFSDSPQAMAHKKELGGEFRRIFGNPKGLSADAKKTHGEEIGQELAGMYKYATDHLNLNEVGDLSNDDVLFDNITRIEYMNPGNFTSSLMNMEYPSLKESFLKNTNQTQEDFEKKPSLEIAAMIIQQLYRTRQSAFDNFEGKVRDGDLSNISIQIGAKNALHAISKAAKEHGGKIQPIAADNQGSFVGLGVGDDPAYEEIFQTKDTPLLKYASEAIYEEVSNTFLPGSKGTPGLLKEISFETLLQADSNTVQPDLKAVGNKLWDAENINEETQEIQMVYHGHDRDGQSIDTDAMRDAYESYAENKGGFTQQQLKFSGATYDNSLGRLYGDDQKKMLTENGLNEFDCIFINGKSVRALCNERNQGKNAAADEAEMKAMVVSAGMYAANNITYTTPVKAADGSVVFDEAKYLNRKESRIDEMKKPSNGFFHRLRYGNEDMQDKFDRAEKSKDEALRKGQEAVDKLREKSFVSRTDDHKTVKSAADGGGKKISVRDLRQTDSNKKTAVREPEIRTDIKTKPQSKPANEVQKPEKSSGGRQK